MKAKEDTVAGAGGGGGGPSQTRRGRRRHRHRHGRRLPRLFRGEGDETGLVVPSDVLSEGHAYDDAVKGRGAVPYRRGAATMTIL